jgi:hypothetical protein
MGMTSASGSVVVTLGEATSLEFILGTTLVDGTWLGLTLWEQCGASGGDLVGVAATGGTCMWVVCYSPV